MDFGRGPQQPILYTMELDSLDVFRHQGVTLRLSTQATGQQPATEHRVSRIDLPWSEYGHVTPFSAEWSGSLYVRDYGGYKLTLEGLGGRNALDRRSGGAERPERDRDPARRWLPQPEGAGCRSRHGRANASGVERSARCTRDRGDAQPVRGRAYARPARDIHSSRIPGEQHGCIPADRPDDSLLLPQTPVHRRVPRSMGRRPADRLGGRVWLRAELQRPRCAGHRGTTVVDNPGITGETEGEFESRTGSVSLEAGVHPISITFQHVLGDPQIYVHWWTGETESAPLPPENLVPAPPRPPN